MTGIAVMGFGEALYYVLNYFVIWRYCLIYGSEKFAWWNSQLFKTFARIVSFPNIAKSSYYEQYQPGGR